MHAFALVAPAAQVLASSMYLGVFTWVDRNVYHPPLEQTSDCCHFPPDPNQPADEPQNLFHKPFKDFKSSRMLQGNLMYKVFVRSIYCIYSSVDQNV